MKGIYKITFENNKIIRNIPHPIIDLYYIGELSKNLLQQKKNLTPINRY